MTKALQSFSFEVGDLLKRKNRAVAKAQVAMARDMILLAKDIVHVITGTLQRSIHAAPLNYLGEGDYARAINGEDLGEMFIDDFNQFMRGRSVEIEVGSWIPYANIEENVRAHHFLLPAFNAVTAKQEQYYHQAFREEGLELET